MEDALTPPLQQSELTGEKRKREEGSMDASTEDAPFAPASTGSAEDAAGSGVARHPMWKTSLCSFFRGRGAGAEGCSHGESCRYAHTEEELRPRPNGTWDPTSDRAKKLRKVAVEAEEEVTVDACVGLRGPTAGPMASGAGRAEAAKLIAGPAGGGPGTQSPCVARSLPPGGLLT